MNPFYGAYGVPFIQHCHRGPTFMEIMMLTHHRRHDCCDYGFNFHHGHHGYGRGWY